MIVFQNDANWHCLSIKKAISRVAKSLHKYCFGKNSLLNAIWRWQEEKVLQIWKKKRKQNTSQNKQTKPQKKAEEKKKEER